MLYEYNEPCGLTKVLYRNRAKISKTFKPAVLTTCLEANQSCEYNSSRADIETKVVLLAACKQEGSLEPEYQTLFGSSPSGNVPAETSEEMEP